MTHSSSSPDSISHKELAALISSAGKDAKSESDLSVSEERKEFEKILNSWDEISKQLISFLDFNQEKILEGIEPQSAMAIGVLQAHLSISIQASEASKKSQQ